MPNLVFIRHAHRDTSRREADNGLSEKGESQAQALGKFFKRRMSAEPEGARVFLYSSPKKRCLQTLTPIADVSEATVQIDPLADEQSGSESSRDLVKRCREFLSRIQKLYCSKEHEDDWIIVCSHGDWLPVALSETLSGACDIEIKKGFWCHIREGRLISLLQPSDYI